jgi:hypothetical protein
MRKQDYHVQPETMEEIAPMVHRSRTAGTIISDKTLDAWWQQLSRAKKTELYTGNYVIKLEGVVS